MKQRKSLGVWKRLRWWAEDAIGAVVAFVGLVFMVLFFAAMYLMMVAVALAIPASLALLFFSVGAWLLGW